MFTIAGLSTPVACHSSQRKFHSAMAEALGIDRKTLYARLRSTRITQEQYSTISTEDLVEHVRVIKEQLPNAGRRLISGALLASSIHVQRARVVEVVRIVDAGVVKRKQRKLKRRVYSAQGPQSVWHIDGNHKLIRWKLVVHGGIDGYSRLIPYMQCSNNNTSNTAASAFLEGVEAWGLPSRVRTDHGTENTRIWRIMLRLRGTNRRSTRVGRSVHNQRIERLWRDLNVNVIANYRAQFYDLENNWRFDVDNDIHIYCLHLVYLSKINDSISSFVKAWNHHSMRTEGNRSPMEMWINDMDNAEEIVLQDDENRIQSQLDQASALLIEPEGEREQAVVIPPLEVNLTQDDLTQLHHKINVEFAHLSLARRWVRAVIFVLSHNRA
jgi:hypothetical protein